MIEIATTGPQYNDVLSYAGKIQQELAKIAELRDLGYEEPLHYPTVNVNVNRVMAGQLGTTADQDRTSGGFRYRVESVRFSQLLERPTIRRELPGASRSATGPNDLYQGH